MSREELLSTLEARAQRLVTPGGAGELVWHAWGAPDAPPVVLLHGGSGSWTHWLTTIQPLVDSGRRVLAADLPGFGDSAPPAGGEDADAMPAPLEGGLQQLLGDAPVELVGFSFGGLVSGLWAAAHPQRVKRLVIVGAPGMGVRGPEVGLRGWRHLPGEAARDAIHRHNLGVLMLHDKSLIDDAVLSMHRHNVLRDKLPRRRLPRTTALADALGRVRCPVHVIYGALDALFAPVATQVQAAYEAAAPTLGSFEWIEGAGHWVQYERPAAFEAALLRALGPAGEGEA